MMSAKKAAKKAAARAEKPKATETIAPPEAPPVSAPPTPEAETLAPIPPGAQLEPIGEAHEEKEAQAPTPPEETEEEKPKARRKPTAAQIADEAALLGKMTPTERAMFHFGLESRHVLRTREIPQEDGSVEVGILTQGGQRLYYPRDAGRTLTPMEKGEAGPGAEAAGVFPAK
jgi:hypothetical protein